MIVIILSYIGVFLLGAVTLLVIEFLIVQSYDRKKTEQVTTLRTRLDEMPPPEPKDRQHDTAVKQPIGFRVK